MQWFRGFDASNWEASLASSLTYAFLLLFSRAQIVILTHAWGHRPLLSSYCALTGSWLHGLGRENSVLLHYRCLLGHIRPDAEDLIVRGCKYLDLALTSSISLVTIRSARLRMAYTKRYLLLLPSLSSLAKLQKVSAVELSGTGCQLAS